MLHENVSQSSSKKNTYDWLFFSLYSRCNPHVQNNIMCFVCAQNNPRAKRSHPRIDLNQRPPHAIFYLFIFYIPNGSRNDMWVSLCKVCLMLLILLHAKIAPVKLNSLYSTYCVDIYSTKKEKNDVYNILIHIGIILYT